MLIAFDDCILNIPLSCDLLDRLFSKKQCEEMCELRLPVDNRAQCTKTWICPYCKSIDEADDVFWRAQSHHSGFNYFLCSAVSWTLHLKCAMLCGSSPSLPPTTYQQARWQIIGCYGNYYTRPTGELVVFGITKTKDTAADRDGNMSVTSVNKNGKPAHRWAEPETLQCWYSCGKRVDPDLKMWSLLSVLIKIIVSHFSTTTNTKTSLCYEWYLNKIKFNVEYI